MPDEKITVIQRVAEDGSNAFGYLWFILLAIWGGSVSYIRRLKEGVDRKFSALELTGEWTISGFSGLLTAFLCAEMGVSYYLTAVACAISGHMGGGAIKIIENLFKSKLPGGGQVSAPCTKRDDKDDR